MATKLEIETIEDLLSKDTPALSEEFMTGRELAEHLGIGHGRLLRIIGRLRDSGRVEIGTRTTRNLIGRVAKIPVYKINVKPSQKKAPR